MGGGSLRFSAAVNEVIGGNSDSFVRGLEAAKVCRRSFDLISLTTSQSPSSGISTFILPLASRWRRGGSGFVSSSAIAACLKRSGFVSRRRT